MRLVKYHAYRESIALHLSERSEESREMLRFAQYDSSLRILTSP
jgi:hypothetical protein